MGNRGCLQMPSSVFIKKDVFVPFVCFFNNPTSCRGSDRCTKMKDMFTTKEKLSVGHFRKAELSRAPCAYTSQKLNW
jgi:hypothetical protein